MLRLEEERGLFDERERWRCLCLRHVRDFGDNPTSQRLVESIGALKHLAGRAGDRQGGGVGRGQAGVWSGGCGSQVVMQRVR